jgi:AcrR family transcriptional regulator
MKLRAMMKSRAKTRLTFEQRRMKLLAAATRIFATQGYEGASMNEIAAAAGVSKPVLYDHFESKDALFETVICSIRDSLLAKGRAIAVSSASEEDRFRGAVNAFFTFVEKHPDDARVLLIVPQGHPDSFKLSKTVQEAATAGISELLKSYLPDSEKWRLLAASEFLKEGLHALARWWLSNPGPNRDDIVDIVMTACWDGFKAIRKRTVSRRPRVHLVVSPKFPHRVR